MRHLVHPSFPFKKNPVAHSSKVGVVSWAHGCADPDSLGIYSEVSHNLKWLKKKMKRFKTCPAYSDDE